MNQVQNITHAPGEGMRPWIVYLAYAVLVYPIVPLLALYGEWGLAWFHLGHQPLPSADDPKFIDGSSWMHPVVELALVFYYPACCAAPVFISTCVAIAHDDWKKRALKLVAIPCLWIGSVVLLILDPWGVMYWWLD